MKPSYRTADFHRVREDMAAKERKNKGQKTFCTVRLEKLVSSRHPSHKRSDPALDIPALFGVTLPLFTCAFRETR
jgi:hypothetical protein